MDISTLQSNLDFIKSLYLLKEWKDEDCKNEVLEAIKECNQNIEEAFGWSMHKLSKHKPTVEVVEKVVKKFPSTLSYVNEDDGSIPIQTAAGTDGYDYVPILAKEGMKHKVGGEDARGGLLKFDPGDGHGYNTLQVLSNFRNNGDEEYDKNDAMRVSVMKELRKLGLFVKKDIREQQLLLVSCWKDTKQRFEYLIRWDPDALLEPIYEFGPLLHSMPLESDDRIIMALKAGFKYHPNIGGLLFIQRDFDGNTGLDYLFNKKGAEEVMSLLHDILSPTRDYPILHHVFIKAPQHINLFMRKFRWAYYLKDHNERTLHQAVLAAGPDVMNANDILLTTLSDNQIQTKDPITTLYPFAAMAVGEHADVESTFYLLRRQPSVMDRHSRSESGKISIFQICFQLASLTSSNRTRKKRKVEK